MRKNKNLKGFSLAEIMVSVGIIALMSSIFVVNYKDSNKKSQLIMSAQKMVSDIRLMQNNSLGLTYFNNQIPQGGWGIYLTSTAPDNNKYILFADINNNHEYSSDEKFREISLPIGLTINKIYIEEDGDVENNILNTAFEPPDPITWIGGDNSTVSSTTNANIILQDNNGQTQSVLINFFGTIEVYKYIEPQEGELR